MSNIVERLAEIQKNLNAPKSQYNNFGKYPYRSCEDIQCALKPFLGGLTVTVSDEIIEVGGHIYVKATATITDGKGSLSTTAYARESINKKGMDSSQMTGSASSYARKYALGGLFLVDDTKDADSQNNRESSQSPNMATILQNYKSMSRDQQEKAWPNYNQAVKKYITENIG